MDPMFTRWDPAAHLDTEEAQIIYLKACVDGDWGDGVLIWAGIKDVARAPIAGPFSWGVRTLHEQFVHTDEKPVRSDLVAALSEMSGNYVSVS